jgi:hypothetical protein
MLLAPRTGDPRPPLPRATDQIQSGQARSSVVPQPPVDTGCEDQSEPVGDRRHWGWASSARAS